MKKKDVFRLRIHVILRVLIDGEKPEPQNFQMGLCGLVLCTTLRKLMFGL